MYPTKKLWEVCEIKKWKKVNYSEQWKYNYIDIGILRTNIIEQYTNDEWIFCNKNDILIAWDGSKSGTVGFWLEWVIGSTLAKITIDTKMFSSEFIGKFLQGNFDYLNKNTSGAAIPHLRKDILINLEIPLPPLSTQKLIVEKLDMIFAEIEKSKNLLEKNLQNVDEMNKSVLEKIFAKDKWERKKLWEVCEVIWWWTPKTEISEYWWEDIIWLSPTDLPEVWEITKISNSTKKISILWLQNSSAKLLPVWSVIFSSRATIGKIAINDIELSTNQGFTNFVCSGWVYNYFLAYALKNFTKDIIALSNSTTFKEVNKTNLRNFSIPLPPLETQKNIVSYLDNIFAENQKLKNLYQAQIKNLDEMKQSFLKKAFAGELV